MPRQTRPPLAKVGAPWLGAIRLILATALLLPVAYLLSWQLLWGGMAGSEAPFHLHLVTWVASAFPNLPWWYQWDGMGVSYREAYPLAAHWLAVLVSRLLGTGLESGAQVIQFALMPATAIGLYAFFDWRLRRPLAGFAAALLFLLSPIGWVEWTHFGLYASWVGMVFFMPCLIALDAFFGAWLSGDRGGAFRLAGVSYIVLVTVMGVVSPHLLAAPLILAPAYAIAIPRGPARRVSRWLLVVVPALFLGIALLSAFWLGAELQYLAVVRSHWAGPGSSFDAARLSQFDLGGILSLHPLRDRNVDDLYSISPAVLLPALLGVTLAYRDARARLFLLLAILGIAFMTDRDLYRPLFVMPGFKEFGVVAHRPLQLLLAISAPALASLGLFELPRLLADMAIGKRIWPAWAGARTAVAVTMLMLVVLAADVFAFAARVDQGTQLAYGPSIPNAPNLADLWQHHPPDACSPVQSAFAGLCGDRNLATRFSIQQLVSACRKDGQTRVDAPVCRGLRLDDPLALGWNGDSNLIAQTASWCQQRQDPVCDAVNVPLAQQVVDLRQWRVPRIACDLDCPAKQQALASLGATFPSPPARAELNSNIGPLDMAFNTLVGGGITHSYNDQVIPSRELSSWLEDSMLQNAGTVVKTQLAQALGIDAVVLSNAQAGRAADYTLMGWTQVSQQPVAFVNPEPSGLAAQWHGGTSVLVVGATQTSVPELYNSVFKAATTGLLPFASEWLVRGPSAYVDDYTDQQLARYHGLFLLGYRYHDRVVAWSRLEHYVRAGGRLFVETGWQYVDPDWNAGPAPAVLPVPSLQWSTLNPSAPVLVEGSVSAGFGKFVYGAGGWGASSSASVRPGASELVRVGSRVVLAGWPIGLGRVLWSGMNLVAHNATSGSADEARLVAAQLEWLFERDSAHGISEQASITPVWNGGNEVSLPLDSSVGPDLVLFKESLFPGWSARLVTPTGSRSIDLVSSEMDFMLADLNSVPAGSVLVFTYGPTAFEQGSWFLSLVFVTALFTWAICPACLTRGLGRVVVRGARMTGNARGRLSRWAALWGGDP